MTKHAILSASSSSRWMACPPSLRLTEHLPDETSSFAQEGTDAHELCAYLVEKTLGRSARDPTNELTYYSQEMQDCAQDYCNYVMEQIGAAKGYSRDPTVLIEQRLDFSKWVPEGFGTGDCIIVADNYLHVIDYKHGLGVLVEAENNSQMMCYALGALDLFDSIYDISTITMTIFQPRRHNVSRFTITKEELLVWADNDLSSKAKLAFEGKGELASGKHCQFCKLKSVCRKRAEDNLALARMEFADPTTLDNVDIAEILPKLDPLIAWANDIKAYALEQAKEGNNISGFKLVEGRSNRKFTNLETVVEKVEALGLSPYEQKLLSVTAMTKLLGKKQFDSLLGEHVIKPTGKPTLVPDDDSRQELATAKYEFKED